MKHLVLLVFALSFISIANAETLPNIHTHGPKELTFKENKNQWYSAVKFLGEVPGGKIFIEQQGFTFLLLNGDDMKGMHPKTTPEPVTIHGHVYKVDFVGSNDNATFTKEGESAEYYNYFLGNDQSKWAPNVHAYDAVTYHDLYKDVDMKVYGKGLSLKYDLILHPGADASLIQFRYRGVDDIFLRNENLVIQTSVGKIVEVKPYAYQLVNGVKKEVPCLYKLTGDRLSFTFPKGYDNTKDVVIDPQLIFSTYTGSTADNWGWTATYDDAGNMYLGGYVNIIDFTTGLATGIYPTTSGAFQTTWAGGTGAITGTGSGIGFSCDMGITKLNSTGTALIYSTYLGGGDNECPHSLFVNSLGQLCVFGDTYSTNYPVSTNAYDKIYNGKGDMVVTVFNTTGTALVGSTYIGGTGQDGINFDPTEFTMGNLKIFYMDNARGEVICDNQDNIYIASSSSSANFPATSGSYQASIGGQQDACVVKLNPDCSSLLYATFLGGTKDDAAYSLSLKSDYSVYVTGGTMSSNFPSTHTGVNPNYLGGHSDGWLAHVNAAGSSLLHSTFLGTDSTDQSYSVKLDKNENVYVLGLTDSIYPVTSGVYSNPNSGQFISKFKSSLDSVFFSTVFGNGDGKVNIIPTAFGVDSLENIYAAGWGTRAFTFVRTTDMSNMPVTSNAYQDTTIDGTDFFIIVLKKDAASLQYATYFGGHTAFEHVDGGTSRFDKNGILYQAICASCGGYAQTFPITDGGTPSTAGVWSTTNKATNCNELGLKFYCGASIITGEATEKPLVNTDGLILYPNPSSGKVTVSVPVKGTYTLEITNILGQQIISKNAVFGKKSMEIDLAGAAPGVYFVQLSSEKRVFSSKLLIQAKAIN